jgi:hypothetical protein
MSESIFRYLLQLYPHHFREQYGDSMRQLFCDRLRTETGLAGRTRLWWEVLTDLALSIPREHRRRPRAGAATAAGYRMSEEAVSEMAWRGHARPSPVIIVCIVLGAAVGWIGNAPLWILFTVYGALLCLTTAPLLRIGQVKQRWRDFEVAIDGDCIRQIQHGSVTLTLRRDEVTGLVEAEGFGLSIQTNSPPRHIFLPSGLTGYQELREHLATWAPLQHPWDFDRRQFRFHHLYKGLLFLYPAALLVRSAYCAVPLAVVLGVTVLNYARVAFSSSETAKLREVPKWALAARLVTLVLLATLILKTTLVLR